MTTNDQIFSGENEKNGLRLFCCIDLGGSVVRVYYPYLPRRQISYKVA